MYRILISPITYLLSPHPYIFTPSIGVIETPHIKNTATIIAICSSLGKQKHPMREKLESFVLRLF